MTTATIRLQREPFDAAAEAAALTRGRTDIGAVVTFTGICRGDENGAPIAALTLEHYPGMAEAEIARHVEEAQSALVAARRHRHPSLRPHCAGRGHRAGGHGVVASPRRVRGRRIPDGLSEDARAVLEARRERRRRNLGRGQIVRRYRRRPLGETARTARSGRVIAWSRGGMFSCRSRDCSCAPHCSTPNWRRVRSRRPRSPASFWSRIPRWAIRASSAPSS